MSEPTIVIRDFPHPANSGLGVSFNFIFWQMLRYRGRKTWVNIDKPNNPYRCERGPNPWDYYFQQEAPAGETEEASVEDPLDLPFSGHRDWTVGRSNAASRFARERIRLLPDIQAEVDSFVRQHFKGTVLAVGVRGTDKISEYQPAKDEQIISSILALKEQFGCSTIFLMTDDKRYHKIITERTGALSLDIPRSDVSLHHNPPRGPYESGRLAVMDAFIASRANFFFYTPSNFATISLIMGEFQAVGRLPSKCVIEPFCQRVDRALGLLP